MIKKHKYVKSTRVNSVISPTIRVAVGDVHRPLLTVVRIEEEAFFCTHDKHFLPDPRKLAGEEKGVQHKGKLEFFKIGIDTWQVISEAINTHEKYSGFHINPHTFLVAWCLSKGVDLYELGLLSL